MRRANGVLTTRGKGWATAWTCCATDGTAIATKIAAQGRLFIVACMLFNACGSTDSTAPDDAAAGGTSFDGAGGTSAGAPASGGSAGTSAGSAGTSGGSAGSGGAAGTGIAGAGGASSSVNDGGGEGSSVFADAGAPNIGADVKLLDLTDQQKGLLCDWMMAALGGYGAVNDCGGNAVMNYANQAQCIAAGLHYQCMTATVGQLERCVVAEVPSKGCSTPTEECRALYCVQ